MDPRFPRDEDEVVVDYDPSATFTFDEADVQLKSNLENIIVVDNIPVVSSDRVEKLRLHIHKLASKCGTITPNGLYLPVDELGGTRGYCFIEYELLDEAKQAMVTAPEGLDQLKLDKNHTLKVSLFSDFERFAQISEEVSEFAPKPYEPKENMRAWLQDDLFRDQFFIRHYEDTEIHWNDPLTKSVIEYHRPNMTLPGTTMKWSPLGTYLVAIAGTASAGPTPSAPPNVNIKGFELWGGSWKSPVIRFFHPGVREIDFSPKETFVVSFSPLPEKASPETQNLCLFDLRTGRKMVTFAAGDLPFGWPALKWSHDEKYVARMTATGVEIYDTSNFKLIGGDVVSETQGCVRFDWSPTDNQFAYFVSGSADADVPARAGVMSVPTLKDLRSKKVFGAQNPAILWQNKGEYLCIKADKYDAKGKKTGVCFELFRLKEKAIPTETLEVLGEALAFSWEPKGTRFAIIQGALPKTSVSFYDMGTSGSRHKLLSTIENKTCNLLFWSPRGRYILLAGLSKSNAELEFFDAGRMETISQAEHFCCTNVEWDPSGRYLCSYVSGFKHQSENGYILWSFQGAQLAKIPKAKFWQFSWRPRPASLLPEEQQRNIAKNLKKRIEQFEADAQGRQGRVDEDRAARNRRLVEEWDKFVKASKKQAKQEAASRRALLGLMPGDEESSDQYVEMEEFVEIILDEKREPIVEDQGDD